MRNFHITGQTGWLAGLVLLLSLCLVVTSLGLLTLNIYYSAVGMIEATGGKTLVTTTIWFPSLAVVEGGQLALGFGIVAGIMVSVVQFLFWTVDNAGWRGMARVYSLFTGIVIIYDVLSTWYYLSGTDILNLEGGFGGWLVRTAIRLIVTLIFLSVGSELWMTLGIEFARANWHEGWKSFRSMLEQIGQLREPAEQGGGGNGYTPSLHSPGRPSRPHSQQPRPMPSGLSPDQAARLEELRTRRDNRQNAPGEGIVQ